MAEEEPDTGLIDAELESIGVPQFVDFQAPDFGREDTDIWFHEASVAERHRSNDRSESFDVLAVGDDLSAELDNDEAEVDEEDGGEAVSEREEGEIDADEAVPVDDGPAEPEAYHSEAEEEAKEEAEAEAEAASEEADVAAEPQPHEAEPSEAEAEAPEPEAEPEAVPEAEPEAEIDPAAEAAAVAEVEIEATAQVVAEAAEVEAEAPLASTQSRTAPPTAPSSPLPPSFGHPGSLAVTSADCLANLSPSPNTSSPGHKRFVSKIPIAAHSPRTPEPAHGTPLVTRPEPQFSDSAERPASAAKPGPRASPQANATRPPSGLRTEGLSSPARSVTADATPTASPARFGQAGTPASRLPRPVAFRAGGGGVEEEEMGAEMGVEGELASALVNVLSSLSGTKGSASASKLRQPSTGSASKPPAKAPPSPVPSAATTAMRSVPPTPPSARKQSKLVLANGPKVLVNGPRATSSGSARLLQPTAASEAKLKAAAAAAELSAHAKLARTVSHPVSADAMTRLTKSTIAAEARTAQPALEPAQKLTRPATGSVGGLMRLFQPTAATGAKRVSAAEAAIPDEAVSKPKSRLGGFSRLWKPTAAAEAKQKGVLRSSSAEPTSTLALLAAASHRPQTSALGSALRASNPTPTKAHPTSASYSASGSAALAMGSLGQGACDLPLSTDEIRLLQAEAEVADSRLRQKQRADRLQRVLQDVGARLPSRSTKSLTMPSEFHFAMSRVKAMNNGEAVSPRIPLAEAVSKFSFRGTKAAEQTHGYGSDLGEDSSLSAGGTRGPTLFRPFSLHTDARARPNTVLSTEERQLLAMAEARATSRARPVNQKVMESSGHMGVPRVQKAAGTKFAEFSFQSNVRSARLSSASENSDLSSEGRRFQARPVPSSTYTPERAVSSSRTFGAGSRTFVPTAPRSPQFASRFGLQRTSGSTKAHSVPASPTSSPHSKFRARPMPVGPTPELKLAPKGPTEFSEFNLQTNVRHALADVKQCERRRLEEEEANNARHFKARGVPTSEPFVPQAASAPLCSPKPFNFQSEARHALAQATFEAMVADQENEQKRHAQFKARPCTVTKAQPFQTHKSTKPLTELQEVTLHSDERFEERCVYEAEARQRRMESEKLARKAASETAERERLELSTMRKAREFKARPVPASVLLGQPVSTNAVVKKTLTVAMSPKFQTVMRALARRVNIHSNGQ